MALISDLSMENTSLKIMEFNYHKCNLVPGNQLGPNLDLSNCRLLYREVDQNLTT